MCDNSGEAVASVRGGVPSGGLVPFPLASVFGLAAECEGARGWHLDVGQAWTSARPPGRGVLPLQGWKLHVSAVPLSAPLVLFEAARVLVRHGCHFKFAGSLERVEELVSAHYDRGGAGKFITAYPRDVAQFVRLARELDQATSGLPGPVVLSDRPVRRGSLVHYRYGAFAEMLRLGSEGLFELVVKAPDGSMEEDRRQAWYAAPAWAEPALPEPAGTSGLSEIVLAGRFQVTSVIRHANKGGVFRAVDRDCGKPVVVKQARRHTGADLAGWDAQSQLRQEAEVLGLLESLPAVPALVRLFEHDGDLYLAQEEIAGRTLQAWTSARHHALNAPSPAECREVFGQILSVVEAVHGMGLVLRDLTPGNLMVEDGTGAVRLIDLECAARPGDTVPNLHTPGYASPEQLAAPRIGPAPDQATDLYSLGAVLFFLLTGGDLLLAKDEPPLRPPGERTTSLIQAVIADDAEVRTWAPLLLGLLNPSPRHRWTLAQAQEFTQTRAHANATTPPAQRRGPVRRPASCLMGKATQAVPGPASELLSHITESLDEAAHGRHLWPPAAFAALGDPCNVQHGAAGVLAVLTHAAGHNRDLLEPVDRVSRWLSRQITPHDPVPPGLYSGRSGTVCALYRAARLLEKQSRAHATLAIARRAPTQWPHPGICHGLAGAGLAQLTLWDDTGQQEFLDRARTIADHLHTAAIPGPQGVVWTTAADHPSRFAGTVPLGFAHGIAGIGYFLLAMAQATGEDRYLDLAVQAGTTLARTAIVEGTAALWPAEPGRARKPASPLAASWSNGSAGIGTYLIRLWHSTANQEFRHLAEGAAATVHAARWRSDATVGDGLAGHGEFLLDMDAFLPGQGYRAKALDVGQALRAHGTIRGGRTLFADATRQGISFGYLSGLSGTTAFLLRLQHGGPRLWMPDSAPATARQQPPQNPAKHGKEVKRP